MEQGPKISIIVPVYNFAPYLRQCLDSLVGQTYRDIEIICADDGSTDESGEILDQYAAEDLRIRALHIENSGVPAARNLALDHAAGEYVIFVDGDDWIETNTCETVLAQAAGYDLVMWPYIDGSTDDTFAVARAYQKEHPEKIILLKNECNMGLDHTLNRCLQVADGAYIARMDGDDISLPTRLEKEVRFLDGNPKYAIVSCSMIFLMKAAIGGEVMPSKNPRNEILSSAVLFTVMPPA